MPRLARAELIDSSEIACVHVMARTVRRCWLMGCDEHSGKNFDHRKDWIESKLKVLAANFGIDLLTFCCMSNHFHLVLRSRPDVVETWSDTEVAQRWWQICPTRKVKREVDGQVWYETAEPTECELNRIRNDPVKLAEIRKRLSDLSWWMRILCQYIAIRANHEDGEGLGRFWQGRFKAVKILDEESLLACAAYVDLNLIRAAMAETIEKSDYTSAQRRAASVKQLADEAIQSLAPPTVHTTPHVDDPNSSSKTRPEVKCQEAEERVDDFLSPVCIDEKNDPIGPRPSKKRTRCSDKGFLAMSDAEYLEILDWLARSEVALKRGSTPYSAPPVFERLQIDPILWSSMVKNFGRAFKNVAGTARSIESARTRKSGRRFYVARV